MKRRIDQVDPLDIGGQPFGVPELVRWAVNSQPSFNSDGPGIRRGGRLEAAVAEPGPWTLAEDDWVALREALEAPHVARGQRGEPLGPAYPIAPAHRLVPLLDAVSAARKVES